MKLHLKALIILLFMLFSTLIFTCSAQDSDLKIEVDPFQYENGVFKEWSSEMKNADITTEERGLIYGITISNNLNEPVQIDNLQIQVRVTRTDKEVSTFFDQISSYVYLPPNEETVVYIPVDFGYGEVLGTYVAEIERLDGFYSTRTIEAYPSDFKVVSEDQFDKIIHDKVDALFVIGDVYITIEIFSISLGVTIVGIAAAFYLLKRK